MDFDIAIVTRNRQQALPLSIPLMLSQSRLPRRFIVVDSSDDHEAVRRIVESCVEASNASVELQTVRSPAGIALQRNEALKRIVSPVVMMPDDDALWYPGVAEAVMRIYERDTEGLIGGVGVQEVNEPPPGAFDYVKPTYDMEFRDKLQILIGRSLDFLEFRFFRDPFFIEAGERTKARRAPEWLPEEDAFPAVTIPGFRLTFRTEMIRQEKFDEALGRYSLFEDFDACLRVLAHHVLVDTRRAKVFHFRSPEKRTNGLEWGALHLLNRAYIMSKAVDANAFSRQRLMRFSYYKVVRYLFQAFTGYGRQRVKGAWRAVRAIPLLDGAPEDELLARFLELRTQCLRPVAAERQAKKLSR